MTEKATKHEKKSFVGKKQLYRSAKKDFKPMEVKKDNMDEQTKDEKEYLGGELFLILQDIKAKISKGEFEENNQEQEEEQRKAFILAQAALKRRQEEEDGIKENNESSW